MADVLRAYAREGIAHVQLVLDPITRDSIEAFAPVLGSLDAEPPDGGRLRYYRQGRRGANRVLAIRPPCEIAIVRVGGAVGRSRSSSSAVARRRVRWRAPSERRAHDAVPTPRRHARTRTCRAGHRRGRSSAAWARPVCTIIAEHGRRSAPRDGEVVTRIYRDVPGLAARS